MTEEQKAKAYNDLKEKYPSLLDSNAEEFNKRIRQEIQSSNVKKDDCNEFEMQKKVSKIYGYGRKQKTLDDKDLTEEERQRLINAQENLKEHCRKVRAFPAKVRYISKVAKNDLLDVDEAKLFLWREVIKPKLGSGDFVFDGYEAGVKSIGKLSYKDLWYQLTLYIIRNNNCLLNINKGLCLIGDVGVGKSFIMECLSLFTQSIDELEPVRFAVASCKDDIVSKLRSEKDFALLNKYLNGAWCYDDLGKESNEVKVFGNSDCVMASILDTQHKKFKATGKITHVTTNILNGNIASIYGDRVADRMNEAYNFIYLKGKSRRSGR